MEIAHQEATLEAQLPAMGRRYIQFGLQNPAYYRLIFQDTLPGVELTAEQVDRMRRSWSIMRETLHAWVQKQHFRGVDVDQEANVLWVIVHGIASLALAGRLPSHDQESLLALFDQAAGRWASGILSAGVSRPGKSKHGQAQNKRSAISRQRSAKNTARRNKL
ncbi:MAG: TetR-like C-terminal domain-containing protein, partial [Candidatus Binatia bacterium]